ncbi:MAG TPA: hypothetical protein VN901_24495 [Candidatus Acidoferrales bacterium]|nr:hypothetical protein [Candidatus Acidoferrales bacterium]
MDHPCYQCGHIVEDGKPFCAQCGAPQIRVAMPEALTQAAAGNVSSRDLPVFSLDPPITTGTLNPYALTGGIEWRGGFRACAIAAFISIVVMSLRLVPPLLAVPAAGSLAVILYHRRHPRVRARSGAQLGALTSVLSSAVFAIFFAIFLAVLEAGGQVRQQMIEALQQVASRSNDPQVQATLDLLVKPENVQKLMLGMVGFVLISIAAGSIAGALTGAFLGRRNRP